MSEKLVTLATFSVPIEAHLAKTKLESEGIECFVADENIVSLNWLYAGAVGGIKLQVRESDVSQAHAILSPEAIDFSLRNDESVARCPKCKSRDVHSLPRWKQLVRKWRRLPRLTHECRHCGHSWGNQ